MGSRTLALDRPRLPRQYRRARGKDRPRPPRALVDETCRRLLTPIFTRQVTHRSATVTYGDGEKPKYRALANAIEQTYRDLLRPLGALEEACFTYLKLPAAKQAEASQRTPASSPFAPASAGPASGGWHDRVCLLRDKQAKPFRYTASQKRIIDEAISLFLAEIAGPDRSRKGFVEGGMESDTPDGILQQTSFQTMLVGVAHAGTVVEQPTTIALSRQSPAVKHMLNDAFTRLSERGKMRLEGVRDEIHGILTSATSAGLSPIETGRQLSKHFEQYKRFEFERLARTEQAFAAEAGSREQYREYGVTHVQWLISSGACPICQAYVGQLIEIEDTENQPPAHPNCLCSTAPAGPAFA